MSHLRDIQKLRHNYNVQPYPISGQRFSQPNSVDRFNPNFDRFIEVEPQRSHRDKFSETNSRFGDSKELLSKTRESRNHRRGYSNDMQMSERKEPELMSPGLMTYTTAQFSYNFSMKLNNRGPNPLTTRRERPQDFNEKQIMPESQTYKQRKVQPQPEIQNAKFTKSSFEEIYPIGKGGFGKVWKVEYKKTGEVMAMKEMYKAKIIQKKSINSVMNERKLLAKLKHPFIINMVCAFQTRENLYLLMDYIDGGDLRYHIGKRRRFSENQTRFFMANMIIGLEYLHQKNIIHRDMKPENMVFDSDGYLRITDMGISRELRQDNHQDTSGTPGYMSPEVICRKNHTFTADYFALGVMGYQFMLGRRPYVGKNRKEIRDQILAKQAMVKPEDRPSKWSAEGADLINKLLTRNPASRLGANGIQEIKSHPWFSTIDWKKLLRKELRAPYVPLSIEDNYDDYKQQISEDTIDDNLEENLLMLRDKDVQSLFEDYYFDRQEPERKRIPSFTTTYSESEYKK